MKKTVARPTPEEYLARFEPHLRELANRLRALVRKTLPNVEELVYPGWNLIGYRLPVGKRSVYLGFISSDADHVHLGFEYGILLPDPQKLLQGQGTQVRYLTVRRASEIRNKPFADLIRAAAQISGSKDKRVLLKLEQDAQCAKKRGKD